MKGRAGNVGSSQPRRIGIRYSQDLERAVRQNALRLFEERTLFLIIGGECFRKTSDNRIAQATDARNVCKRNFNHIERDPDRKSSRGVPAVLPSLARSAGVRILAISFNTRIAESFVFMRL